MIFSLNTNLHNNGYKFSYVNNIILNAMTILNLGKNYLSRTTKWSQWQMMGKQSSMQSNAKMCKHNNGHSNATKATRTALIIIRCICIHEMWKKEEKKDEVCACLFLQLGGMSERRINDHEKIIMVRLGGYSSSFTLDLSFSLCAAHMSSFLM